MILTKFRLGQLVATPSALELIARTDIDAALARHAVGDWGDLDEDDRKENNRALAQGLRLFSSYRSTTGVRFWIITEADRSVTTVLLPDDY